MVMEPDSTSMMSPLNSDLGAEHCAVAMEMDGTDKSDDLTRDMDSVSSFEKVQMGLAAQGGGITAQITVSSSSNLGDVVQRTDDGLQFQKTDSTHKANCETGAETTLSNGGTDASTVVKSGTECGDEDEVPPVDDEGSSRADAAVMAENDLELGEQAIDKNCDVLTGAEQDFGSPLALNTSSEEDYVDLHADQRSCSSGEEVGTGFQVGSSPDEEADAQVHQDSVPCHFDVTDINCSPDLSAGEAECQNMNRAASAENRASGGENRAIAGDNRASGGENTAICGENRAIGGENVASGGENRASGGSSAVSQSFPDWTRYYFTFQHFRVHVLVYLQHLA